MTILHKICAAIFQSANNNICIITKIWRPTITSCANNNWITRQNCTRQNAWI